MQAFQKDTSGIWAADRTEVKDDKYQTDPSNRTYIGVPPQVMLCSCALQMEIQLNSSSK